ncbi:MAG: nucleotidyltransferase domain-containing protein, partial [Planctomycetes bacterium]|nr:nucleotidyltransferase domain-containing protein [Planctomycetota bacterium]
DIDIAIDIGSSINNSLFRDIKDKVENIRTLRSIDIVDLGEVDNNFRNRILRDGKLLNT